MTDTWLIYSKLFLEALLPVALTAAFYLLKRKTKFYDMKRWVQQIIIGVVFGLAAVCGTEFGVNVGGATANARDAAPLCAGLIFGAPAGIIAGVIGGVERWFAAAWGAGYFSRLACSVSTVIAGLYAAVLRKKIFENRRPTYGFCVAVAVVMEVIHLTILFFTHISDTEKVYEIIRIVTIPMILCNVIAVLLSVVIVDILGSKKHRGERKKHEISGQVQTWLLVAIVAAYLFTTVFVYVLQSNTAKNNAEQVLKMSISDVKEDILDESDRNLLEVTRKIAAELNEVNDLSLKGLAEKYDVSEINLVNQNGIITDTTDSEFLGFDLNTGEQSQEFLVLLEDTDEYVQEYTRISYDDESDTMRRKYAGIALDDGGFVQVGYDTEKFLSVLTSYISGLTAFRHVDSTGYVIIADETGNIMSDSISHSGKTLDEIGLTSDKLVTALECFNTEVYGEECMCCFVASEGFRIISVIPQSEIFADRDNGVFLNSFMEVLVFALLFTNVYLLIKKLVVDNIKTVNGNLKEIIAGNLDVKVDVRSSDEFSSLSDDINSTVTTLKQYIDEAAARIDKELAFAKSIQHSALPSVFPAYPNNREFEIYATMDTAKEVGGDFYDFYMLGENKLAFLIADVSGKGIPAAMFMMTAKTMIKNLAETNIDVNEVFNKANARLAEGNEAEMFVTAWLGVIDLTTGHVDFANAGHNPPIHYRKGEGYSEVSCKPGFILAAMDMTRYKLQSFDMKPGDKLYLYTDGVTEATDIHEQLYGEERLMKYLNAHTEDDVYATLKGVKADVDAFVGDAVQFDDITMLALSFNGKDTEIMNEKIFRANDAALADAQGFLEEEMDKAGCGMKFVMQVQVAFEEMFVNVAHYAYPSMDGTCKVGVSVSQDNVMTIRLTDSGIPFNPLAKEDPDITLGADERQIGGLGIFMVKKTMDEVDYRYENGCNVFTMKKKVS